MTNVFFAEITSFAFSGASFLLVCLVSAERGLAIIFPFIYPKVVTTRRIVISGSVMILIALLPLLDHAQVLNFSFKFLMVSIIGPVVTVFIVIVNIKILLIARRHRRQISEQASVSSEQQT